MGKIRKIPTRSLGSDGEVPDPGNVAAWVAERSGTPGDLTSFRLEQELRYQEQAGIDLPCTGGSFYRERVLESITGTVEAAITGELDFDPALPAEDAGRVPPGTWFSIPAPGELGLRDTYYGDPDEAMAALRQVYRRILRAMRDAGAGGHVILSAVPDAGDVEVLAGKKTFCFSKDQSPESLEIILGQQRRIALDRTGVSGLSDGMIEQYGISGILLLDPDPALIAAAFGFVDPDQVTAAGYCRAGCPAYWMNLKESARYEL